MLITGTLTGTLLALDNALGLDNTSFLYPVWQAAVAVRLLMVLRRMQSFQQGGFRIELRPIAGRRAGRATVRS
jgi:hypothetical protein